MVDLNGLTIRPVGAPCGSVTDMSNRHIPPGQPGKGIRRKHLAYQSHILIRIKQSIVINYNPAAFLPPVLQGVQSVISHIRHIGSFRRYYAEYPAFFV